MPPLTYLLEHRRRQPMIGFCPGRQGAFWRWPISDARWPGSKLDLAYQRVCTSYHNLDDFRVKLLEARR